MTATQAVRLLAGAVPAGLLAYRLLLRPRQLRWGASDAETQGAMPGDELIAEPTLVSTRAVTIDAPPERVWPWLVQLGQGRGGFYSYDWIENLIGLEIHSAERILDEHQQLERGDRVALAPDGSGLDVERVEPGRLLVLREPTGGWTWAFLLEPSDGRTRLLARNRWTTKGASLAFRLYMTLIDPAAFIMERKMLLGIKQRAERGANATAGSRPGASARLPHGERLKMQVEHELDRRSVRVASWLLRKTGGRIARPFGRRVLVLTTRGRRSGRERPVPVQYFRDGGTMVVVAANSGLPRPPAWYLNLSADPNATVDVEGSRLAVRAQELPEEEASAFWPRVVETAPDYARYRERTSRPIPLIRLVPTREYSVSGA